MLRHSKFSFLAIGMLRVCIYNPTVGDQSEAILSTCSWPAELLTCHSWICLHSGYPAAALQQLCHHLLHASASLHHALSGCLGDRLQILAFQTDMLRVRPHTSFVHLQGDKAQWWVEAFKDRNLGRDLKQRVYLSFLETAGFGCRNHRYLRGRTPRT